MSRTKACCRYNQGDEHKPPRLHCVSQLLSCLWSSLCLCPVYVGSQCFYSNCIEDRFYTRAPANRCTHPQMHTNTHTAKPLYHKLRSPHKASDLLRPHFLLLSPPPSLPLPLPLPPTPSPSNVSNLQPVEGAGKRNGGTASALDRRLIQAGSFFPLAVE